MLARLRSNRGNQFATQSPELDDRSFVMIRDLMMKKAGIVLRDNKRGLVASRVSRRLRALEVGSYAEYVSVLNDDRSGDELVQLIDAISTNVTFFFREEDHFRILKKVVTELIGQGQRRFRFWSAACSSGEEPYSMAMLLQSLPGAEGLDMRILATDISTKVLQHAHRGEYTEDKLKGLSDALRRRFLVRVADSREQPVYQIDPKLRQMVMFRRFNLNRFPYRIKASFDFIFIRNVMIYFDRELRTRIAAEMAGLLRPDGHLAVGHSESLVGVERDFSRVQPSVYKRKCD